MSEVDMQCMGIVLCDQVIEDKRTGKKSHIGIFNDIMVAKVPTAHPCMFLVLSLTNCRREHEVEIEISRDDEHGGTPVMQLRGRVQKRNPLHVMDLVFEMRGVPLPGVGKYTIEVIVLPERERVAQRAFFVRQIPKPGVSAPPTEELSP